MHVQNLESRRMLSAPTLSHGVLTIQGTEFDDTISVNRNGDGLEVTVAHDIADGFIGAADPITVTYPLSAVRRIILEGGAGNDAITIGQSLKIPAAIAGGLGNDDISGGAENDSIKGGEGNDRIIGSGGDDLILAGKGDDSVTGDDGNDTLLGNQGRDSLVTGSGHDVLDGGTGSDRA